MDLLVFLVYCELLHSLSSVERDIISQHEMPEHLSKGGILLICRVPLDGVNNLYSGVMENVQSTPFFMGFMVFTKGCFFYGYH